MRRVLASTVCCLLAGVATACGSGERQDASEPSRDFEVQVVSAEFPEQQSISAPVDLELTVRNAGDATIPDLAISLNGLAARDSQPGLADPEYPVWIVEDQPLAGQTAYDFTWALGRLDAGETQDFKLRLAPAVPGTHELKWTVAAGLTGKAMARTADGKRPTGTFTVSVADAPAQSQVDPDTGAVVPAS